MANDVDEPIDKQYPDERGTPSREIDDGQPPEAIPGDMEIGATALRQTGGYVREEWLRQLRGHRGIRTYREMRDNDPTIGAVLYAIESLILQADWRIEVAVEDPTPEQIAARDFVDGALFADMTHTWPEMLGDILTMIPYGWAFLETVYKRRNGEDGRFTSRFDDGAVGWRKFGIRSQDSLQRWAFNDVGDTLGMWQNNFYTTDADRAYVFIPLQKALLFTFRSWRNNPEGRSALRNAYRPWYFLKRLEEIEAIGIERDLTGLPVMTAPLDVMNKNAPPNKAAIRNDLYKTIKNIRRDSQEGVLMPPEETADGKKTGFSLRLMSTGGKKSIDPNATIDRYKKDIAMTLLAQFLFLGMGSVGSFALAETDTNLFAVSLGATMDRIVEVMNRHAIAELMRLNGVPQEDWPKMVHGDIETQDITVLANYIATLVGAKALSPEGLEERLRELGGLPPREVVEGEEPADEAAADETTEPAPVAGEETVEQQAPAAAAAVTEGRLFRTGLGGTSPHTHTFTEGASETEPAGTDDHVHALTPGAEQTGPGGSDDHTHTVPAAARGEG